MNAIKTIALCSALMLLAYLVGSLDSELEVQIQEQG